MGPPWHRCTWERSGEMLVPALWKPANIWKQKHYLRIFRCLECSSALSLLATEMWLHICRLLVLIPTGIPRECQSMAVWSQTSATSPVLTPFSLQETPFQIPLLWQEVGTVLKMCLLRAMEEKGSLSAQRIQEDWAHPLHYDGLREKKGTEAWNSSCVSTGLIISLKSPLFLCHGRCKNKEMASVGGLNFLTSYHAVLAPNFGCLSLWCLLQTL